MSYELITATSVHRRKATARGKKTFAEKYPTKRATRCLHPGAKTLQLNDILPGSKLYFEWICETNPDHFWPTTANNRSRYGCPHCYEENRSEKVRAGKTNPNNLLMDRFPKHFSQLISAFNKQNQKLNKETLASKSSAIGLWNIGCGHGPFPASIGDRTQRGSSFGCGYCADKESGKRMREASCEKRGALAMTHPEIASEWVALDKSHGSQTDVIPYTCSATSGFRVWWLCSKKSPTGEPCNREYSAIIADRASGRHNCPDCANRNARGQTKRTSSITCSGTVQDHLVLGAEFRCVLKLGKQHLTGADISIESGYSCLWECSLHPGEEIMNSPSGRLRREKGKTQLSGCFVCSVEKRSAWGYTQGLTKNGSVAETYPELAADWLECPECPSQTPDNTSGGSHLSVLCRCRHHSKHQPWMATTYNRVNGSNCPSCFELYRKNVPRLGALRRRGAITITHPCLAVEFLRCIRLPDLTANELSSGSSEFCEWMCETHHKRFAAKVTDRVIGRSNCPTCGVIKISQAIRRSAINRSGTLRDNYPYIAAQWVEPKNAQDKSLTPDTVSPHSGVYVYWHCNKHEEPFIWPASIGNRTLGHDCPRCNNSKGELAVVRALTALETEFTEQLYVSTLLKMVNKKIEGVSGQLRFDFALIDSWGCIRALIEYHGIQHYEPTNFGGSKRTDEEVHAGFELGCARDRVKKDLADELRIPLLVIPYWRYHDIETILSAFISDVR